MTRLLNILRRHPWSAGGGLVVVLALILAAIGRWYAVRSVANDPSARQDEVVQAALATAERRFESLQKQVASRARQLATDSVVVDGLQTWQEDGRRPSSLVRHVIDLPRRPRTALEIYSPIPRVLAWSGPQMPLGAGPDADAFLQAPQSTIVTDGSVREALAVWTPVRADGRVVGAVRVVQVLRYRPPVQNRYIRDFSLADEWERATGETLRVTWGDASSEAPWPHRLLRGPGGTVLGRVEVMPPSPDRLVRRTQQTYNDLLAGGATLVLLWGIGVVGLWYYRLARRPGARRHPEARTAAAGRFAAAALLWVGARYALLALDVPGRWVEHIVWFSALFDPTRLASAIGGGLFRSIGDLFLTAGWAVGGGVGLVHLAGLYQLRADSLDGLGERIRSDPPDHPSPVRFLGVVTGGLAVLLASTVALGFVVRRVVLDSTLDYFSRTGLLPDPLVFVVLCALFLLVVALVLLGIATLWVGLHLGLRYRPARWPWELEFFSVVMLVLGSFAALYFSVGPQTYVPFPYPLIAVGAMGAAAVFGLVGRHGGADVFTVRGQLLSLFVVTLLLYPLLFVSMDAQRRERMVEAARSFEEGYDPRALYSLQQVLRTAEDELAPTSDTSAATLLARIDSIGPRLVRRSLLASLTTYEVSLSVFEGDGTPIRRFAASDLQARQAAAVRGNRRAFRVLRRTYERQPAPGPIIDRLPDKRGGRRGAGQFQYAGLLGVPGGTGARYWVLLRAEPRSLLPGTGPGVPRVLLPDGSFSDLYAELSLAEFRDGTLVRSFGRSFGRTRLSEGTLGQLGTEPTLWRQEEIRGRQYLTYYRRTEASPEAAPITVAVRIPSILAFDHLYYLLRLTVAGLGVGVLFYLVGLYGRYRQGLLPAGRVRFRDKVLNAFLIVGVVSMVAVGVVGVRVVSGENDRVVEQQLHDQLTRVEETLALEARPGEQLWQVAQRVDVDSLAARVGLDLRLYDDGQLAGTSRPRLVRDGLVGERLPGGVYYALYEEAQRFAAAEAAIGDFRYRVGYQALADDDGRPRLVVGVPTLAQQERVQQEQARTLAYLFGALLVLVVVVMLTAVVLANALAQPIARLREGLEAVGEGRFARPLTVDTRDEIGDLVRTFNEMREQLAESRRKLAQQERELAWREMARQVAHEIKNPLTPMKLSIQHLRRAFRRDESTGDGSGFQEVFDRITTTLIEQIESLVRIADEFSTFARLPTRVPEPLDLNEVIEEAVRLMEEEGRADIIELDLCSEPLVVEADREELRRTYINLLKNARQAIPDDRDGRIHVVTTVATNEEGKRMAQSRVVDNGTGIPPDLRDKIFEPNFSTKTSGTGLGLAIAQKSIDELGGNIGFETTEGQGTTFWVQLPLREEEAEAVV